MFFYFDFPIYFRMLRLAWQEQHPRNRRKLLLQLLVKLPLMAAGHAICFALDWILFPGLWRTEVRTPVFMVGHARSGTTLLHRLMAKDESRFSALMFYEMFFPSLLEKKTIRFFAEVDRRWLGGWIERRVKQWEDRKFGPTNHIHYQSLTLHEEDDFVLTHSCASGYWIVLLPYMGKLDFYYLDQHSPRRRRKLMRFYKECVRRQLYLNGPEKIHLSKNPTFAGRVESLIETFPDARIVVTFRNPYETIPSLLKLMKVAWGMRKWGEEEMQRSLRILAEQSYHTYKYPLEVLAKHPETRQSIVDYAQLVVDPKATIERVYEELGFPMTPEYERVLAAEKQKAKKHETTHAYSLEEFGLRGDEIRTELADLFARFHWDEGGPVRSASSAPGLPTGTGGPT